MPNFTIFTESKADVKFLKDFIAEISGQLLPDSNFDMLHSWSGYKAGGILKTEIRQNFDEGKETIIVLDADVNIEQRRNEVIQDFNTYGIPINLFLFPNNLANGNIESLLAEIAVDRKIMDCFLAYENCVNGHPKPLNDSRIYSYLDMLLFPNPKDANGRDLRREEFRDYRNQAHWDLNHEYLIRLKEFITPFL